MALELEGQAHAPWQVQHFLIIAAPDGKLAVYVNELQITLRIQAQKALQAGEIVWSSDIADSQGLVHRAVSSVPRLPTSPRSPAFSVANLMKPLTVTRTLSK
jgi:hypothetical protein